MTSREPGLTTCPRMELKTLKYEALLLVASILWGSTFVAQQIGMRDGLGPMSFNALRFALGALTLAPLILWRKGRPPVRSEGAFPWAGSLMAGGFLFAAAGTQQIGLQHTTSANSAFITSLYMLFVPVFGVRFGHRIPGILWFALPVSLAGFYLLSVTGDFQVARGDGVTLLSAMLWAGQILAIGHVAVKGDSLRIAGVQFVVCALLSLLAGLLFETPTLAQIRAAWGAIVYAGLISVGVAFTLQVVCQRRCPPAPAALIMSLEAVFAAVAGWLVLNQRLGLRALAGCGLIFGAVLMVQLVPLMRGRGGPHSSRQDGGSKDQR